MQGWSVSCGRWMGVEIRLHALFLLLLTATVSACAITGVDNARGIGLWLVLLGAVVLREVARTLGALALGLELNSVLLLPTGALVTYANGEALTVERERWLAPIGPATNLLAGAVLAGLTLTFSPASAVWQQPWISVGYLLRSLIWANLLLGVLHLLPAVPLDAGRLFRAETARTRGAAVAARAAGGMSRMIAMMLILGGLGLRLPWLDLAGVFLVLAGTLDRQSVAVEGEIDAIRMRDIMLEDFHTLSGADTLEEALDRALHASQDVFPVVRSGSLVGAVSRQSIVEALESGGNGYVQGVMTRGLTTAAPNDPVLTSLRRMSGRGGAQLVPVVDGERVIGIVTPQNLSQSTRLLAHQRRLQRSRDGGNGRTGR